ncbi:hypothetical protein K402DRAFT_389701 [Aulographum hederae CBS 113979]|uniref:GPN-loop GTPase 2 n=1 Tax=Aulographum hederae CBS 113979 TaxID=1176131 RepID=A0A6G1HCM4_9PEZI|nr:hypothetical protein K402DRAFT_389701 [Aulographum hederae CBS 113979]
MPFAQLVIGPPGSGKSTYCDGMLQFMSAIGRRCSVVNLDPANDHTTYPAAVDVRSLISLEEIMEQEELGPNGGVLYALEDLEHNFEWLEEKLKEVGDDYVLFDCPGQVELFTHHASLRNIFFRLQKLGYRLVVVHLIDSYALTLPSLYISAILLSLRSMLQMDLTHINVLTKIDNLSTYPSLPLNLDFYTEVQDLDYLLPHLDAERSGAPPREPESGAGSSGEEKEGPPSKFHALNEALTNLVQDFGLVSFHTLAVEDRRSMLTLLRAIDRAGGYAFTGAEGSAPGANDTVWQTAMREDDMVMEARDVQERWLDRKDELDEQEQKQWEAEGEAWRGEQGDKAGEDVRMGGLEPEMFTKDGGIKIVRKTEPE